MGSNTTFMTSKILEKCLLFTYFFVLATTRHVTPQSIVQLNANSSFSGLRSQEM